MGGGLESRCVGHVYGADRAVHHPHRNSVDVLIPYKIYSSPLPSLYSPSCLRVNERLYNLNYSVFRMLDLNCI